MAVPGYVLKHKRTTLERAEKFISPIYFTDCNLFGKCYPKQSAIQAIRHFAAPGRISFSEAVKGDYKQTQVGTSFGPLWSTHWFQLEMEIPETWIGEEVQLVWDSESEALVWKDGVPLQGLSPESLRTDFTLSKKLTKEETKQKLYVEMACNGLFGGGDNGQINPPNVNKHFKLVTAKLVTIDRDVTALIRDLEILIDIVKLLEESNRSYQALFTANNIVNTVVIGDRESYRRAHQLALEFFSQKNGSTQHTIFAVGNCHIDTAWLWTYDETKRKCARSFSATLRLMDKYPDFKFACSQAQQFEWTKEIYPELYEQMKKQVATERFIPVGGTWVEMDGNIPSGEAFVRQFLLGQKFFKKEFGKPCKEFWLPDTFGYSAQLPQIMKLSGISRFVTQKLSWSLVNKFPHNSFWWKGIDGSSVLTHFPPGNSYCMKGKVEEVLKTLNNFQDKGRSNSSLYLFGFGDGGQGPTEEILERLNRMEDIDGLPRVKMSSPDEFFTRVEKEDSSKLCHWNGELYLEMHNGTYTTQAKTKKFNRFCEFLLREVEIVSCIGRARAIANNAKSGQFEYPAETLRGLWKLVLLNQFHDVLPGSSINLVYKEVEKIYEDVVSSASSLLTKGLQALVQGQVAGDGKTVSVVTNTCSWPRVRVVGVAEAQVTAVLARDGSEAAAVTQPDFQGNTLVIAKAPSVGFSILRPLHSLINPVTIEKKDGNIFLQNGLLEAVIDDRGRIVGLYLPGSKKNAIVPDRHGNQMVMFDDVPLYWDAWDVMDYHLETRRAVTEVLEKAKIVLEGPLRASIEVSLKISDTSYIKQVITLDAYSPYLSFTTEVNWHESHKFLKVEFPVNVIATSATYEIQFGHLKRPTHFNTSWDWARYEVCGHKWADLSEYDWGVAVLNDSKYGWSCIDNILRLSLLRSAKAPDESADMGVQTFTYAVMPHRGTFQSAGVIQAAYDLNCPLRINSLMMPDSPSTETSFVEIDAPSVFLESLKMAEDQDNVLVARLYEAYGGHASAKVKFGFPIKEAKLCDLLEDPIKTESNILSQGGDTVHVTLNPFQIVSILIRI